MKLQVLRYQHMVDETQTTWSCRLSI